MVNRDRIRFIEGFIASEIFWKRDSLISALISCLTPEEACAFLDVEFSQSLGIRRAVLRKITRDIQRDVQECHYRLVRQLIRSAEELPYKKKNSCGHCLSYLYEHLPEETQRTIITSFITSKYVILRRRGYKKLRSQWNPEYQTLICQAWENHKDFECARLMAENFPLSYINQHLTELEEALLEKGPRNLAKLFLRIGAADRSKLERLADLDEITFVYVSAKLQYLIPEEKALEVFENNRTDDRVGLLIWCFGQLRLWSVLVSIAYRADELQREEWARHYQSSRQPRNRPPEPFVRQ